MASEVNNIFIGKTDFIKTVKDLDEIMMRSSSQVKFGIDFCEVCQLCLIRLAGNDRQLELANINASRDHALDTKP